MTVKRLRFGITLASLLVLSNVSRFVPTTAAQSPAGPNLFTAPLTSTDIGDPTIPGRTTPTESGFAITASGRDIWDHADEFHFAYETRTGDFDVIVRVASLAPTHLYTRAGIMARENLSAGSRHVFFLLFPDNRRRHKNTSAYEFQYRAKPDGDSAAIYPPQKPGPPAFPVDFPHAWLRLERVGNTFTASVSPDAHSWRKYCSYAIALPGTVLLGLAVTSETESAATTAVFTDLGVLRKN